MNRQTILFLALITFCLAAFSHSTAYSLFSSSASSNNNTFTAAASFPTATPSATLTPTSTPTATPTPPIISHIVINELSSDGNNQAEWIELYNLSPSPVDISGWLIGNTINTDPLPSGSIIAANGFAVIIPNNSKVSGIPGSATTITLAESQIGNGLTDAGDTVLLRDSSSVLVDQLSYGSDTSVFPTPPASPGSNQSLARNPNGTDTDAASDWIIDSSPTLGTSNP